MSQGPTEKLYSPSVLALAVELASYPFDAHKPQQGYAKSRTCGSEVHVSLSQGHTGAIEQLGLRVKACAVGQASATLFASYAEGRQSGEIADMADQITQWIAGDAPSTVLPRLELIEAARAYPARHEAIVLPWRAAIDALSSEHTSR